MVHRVVELVRDKFCFQQSEAVTIQVILVTLEEPKVEEGQWIDTFQLTFPNSTSQCRTPRSDGHECMLAGAANHLESREET
jgi:hypothetical protein